MLATNDPALRRDVIRILKAMHVTLAKPFVVGETSSASAERLLDDAIGRNKARHAGLRHRPERRSRPLALGRRDQKTHRRPATRSKKPRSSGSARLALEYARLRPDERLAQCQALVLGLEADALTSGRPSPAIVKLLATADGDMLNMVLSAAMKHDLPRAAVAAAKTLGKRGDAGVLYAVSPQPSAARRCTEISRIAACASPRSRRS